MRPSLPGDESSRAGSPQAGDRRYPCRLRLTRSPFRQD
jgi:hypothetical protein